MKVRRSCRIVKLLDDTSLKHFVQVQYPSIKKNIFVPDAVQLRVTEFISRMTGGSGGMVLPCTLLKFGRRQIYIT